MSRRQRSCEYSISGSNLNIDRIICELSQCGIHDVKVCPKRKTISIKVNDPSPTQSLVIDRYFNTSEDFPKFNKIKF